MAHLGNASCPVMPGLWDAGCHGSDMMAEFWLVAFGVVLLFVALMLRKESLKRKGGD